MNTGPSFLYYMQNAQAQAENAKEENLEIKCNETTSVGTYSRQCCLEDLCCFDDSPMSISALIVVPIALFCIKIPIQKKWLEQAGCDGYHFDLFIMRGWALGLFLAVCGFIGLLYSPVTKQGLNQAGCGVPTGWLPLVIILGLISTIFLLVSFVKKPKSVTA